MWRATSSAKATPVEAEPRVTIPWVGSQRRLLAKITMNTIPSQNGGVE